MGGGRDAAELSKELHTAKLAIRLAAKAPFLILNIKPPLVSLKPSFAVNESPSKLNGYILCPASDQAAPVEVASGGSTPATEQSEKVLSKECPDLLRVGSPTRARTWDLRINSLLSYPFAGDTCSIIVFPVLINILGLLLEAMRKPKV